jgi:hypothetical protein
LTDSDATSNFAHFDAPDSTPEQVELCGDNQCTGLKNVIILKGSTGGASVITNQNTGISGFVASCNSGSNGIHCSESGWGHLHLQSNDADKFTRYVHPVVITNTITASSPTVTFSNSLNAYKNKYLAARDVHTTNSNHQLARFASIIKAGNAYDVKFTSATPKSLKVDLDTLGASEYAIIRVFYNTYENIAVYNGASRINPKALNPVVPVALSSADICGANIYHYDAKYVEVVIKNDANCDVELRLTGSILASVRYEMTPEEFYANNGPTLFIDRVAAVLGVEPWRVKIVSIERGSTRVNYFVEEKNGDKNSLTQPYLKFVTSRKADYSILGSKVLNLEYYQITDTTKSNRVVFTNNHQTENNGNNGNDNTNSPTNIATTLSGDSGNGAAAAIGGGVLAILVVIIVVWRVKKSKSAKKATMIAPEKVLAVGKADSAAIKPRQNEEGKENDDMEHSGSQHSSGERQNLSRQQHEEVRSGNNNNNQNGPQSPTEDLSPEPMISAKAPLKGSLERLVDMSPALVSLDSGDMEPLESVKRPNVGLLGANHEGKPARKDSGVNIDLFPRRDSLFNFDPSIHGGVRKDSSNSSGILDQSSHNSQHIFFDYDTTKKSPKRKSHFVEKKSAFVANLQKDLKRKGSSSDSPNTADLLRGFGQSNDNFITLNSGNEIDSKANLETETRIKNSEIERVESLNLDN